MSVPAWIPIAITVGKYLWELCDQIAKAFGESTETVRDRVIAELKKPQVSATDSIAKAIEDALPDEPSDR